METQLNMCVENTTYQELRYGGGIKNIMALMNH